ncbi:dihydrolipoyllysine-residue acetyltransferase component 1 of pyruvate dehydrogenase complex, mitochondrial-like [Durio zibethinus]|uniref:Dihydrolipoyllysine-residue acetyltransferase component 1 of pyruvate dehydrogenase complex, mitochondrial-like n=1 Tax=Durio zibethinus TaxID=66656 RepID=A0A6P5Z1W4_DURZI|nr:dihydrolipoyllysine-residue acetyltransferase component 1 of pyruvate dehydrogenase complex, mitochondrial-like [Durio zibethinus]
MNPKVKLECRSPVQRSIHQLSCLEHGLDASSLKASGPRGILLKGDVLAAIKSGKGSSKISSSEKKKPSTQISPKKSPSARPESKAHPQQSDSFEDLSNTQIRKVIGMLRKGEIIV